MKLNPDIENVIASEMKQSDTKCHSEPFACHSDPERSEKGKNLGPSQKLRTCFLLRVDSAEES